MQFPLIALTLFSFGCAFAQENQEQGRTIHHFERILLDPEFYAEGATFGDLNRDEHADLIAGPWWYQGPSFENRYAFYSPKTFDPSRYSENFFAFVHDFNRDGWNDILIIGFPGKDASWFQNPGNKSKEWIRHRVLDGVDNESPTFTDLTGDGEPEIVCQQNGKLGWAGPDPVDPTAPWVFRQASADNVGSRFTHGLGVGDINGDGRKDLLMKTGWWQQPESLDGNPVWDFHAFSFSRRRGGAQMLTLDADGDGDTDIVTSLDAHGWGLSWFEQIANEQGGINFREHRIIDSRAEDNPYGVSFSQMHAMCLADIDGDGLQDVITGKRFWAHGPDGDPDSAAPAVVYWFRLQRSPEGKAEFIPHLADDDSGIGVQVVAGDVNADGLPDIVISNKKGTFLLSHRTRQASTSEWNAAQPKRRAMDQAPRFENGISPLNTDGKPLDLSFESGDLQNWVAEGDAFTGQPIQGDSVEARLGTVVSHHQGNYWVGGYELHGDSRTGTLTSLPFKVTHPWASMLVGGGKSHKTRVELVRVADKAVIFMTPGASHETMQRVAVNLGGFLGQELRIRLVDESTGGWGHLNYDDFLFHESKPKIVQERKLPRIIPYKVLQQSGLEAEAAVRAMTVPEGFEVKVIAAEPDLHQPIAFTTDADGRLWVVEAYSYPQRRAEGEGLDKIIVFEDSNSDGEYETRHVFAEGLNLVSGLEVGFGGVWVGAAPYLMFIPDQDGDLIADGPPEVLLDGWGYEDTHETLNSFIWGPDGWLYGCQGVFTHSRVGKPGTPDAEREPINAGVWRFHPQKHEFEVFSWGTSNPWGVDFDDHGQAFMTACVVPHLYHLVQGGRFQRQSGRHFNPFTFDDIKTIADHRHYAGKVSDHAWWGRNAPVEADATEAAGGGHAHCGAMVYLGDNFPQEYRNTIFMNNVLGNRINRDLPTPVGSGYSGSHATDFLLANDQWYRGVNMKYGPDGGVFFIDWYDRQACHRHDPEIWDRTNGRLFKVSWGNPKPQAVALKTLSNLELVELQLHQNDWYVRTARKILQERGGDERTWHALNIILHNNPDVTRRLRALWALHVSGGLNEKLVTELLDDRNEHIRAWTIQLSLENQNPSPQLLSRLSELAREDSSPVVRLYLAAGLQRIPPLNRWDIATNLLSHSEDSTDHNLPLMYWYGIESLAEADPERAIRLALDAQVPPIQQFMWRRLALGKQAGLQALCTALTKAKDDQVGIMLSELDSAVDKRPDLPMPSTWPAAAKRLLAMPAHRNLAAKLALAFGDISVAPLMRTVLVDRERDLHERENALSGLVRVRDPGLAPTLHAILPEEPLCLAALNALAAYDHPNTPQHVLPYLNEYDSKESRAAIAVLTARANHAVVLLKEVLAGTVSPAVLDDATVRRQLAQLQNQEVSRLLESAWGRTTSLSESAEMEIAKWKKKLAPAVLAKADQSNGRAIYARTCSACHTLFGEGGSLGPDITGSNRSDLDYILRNIVEPSAEVGREYLMTTVRLADGRVVSGMVTDENSHSITLQSGETRVIVPLTEIKRDSDGNPIINRSSVSIMPPGQLLAFTDSEVRDLVAYLASPNQVPLP
ncbi:MAG TPA: PVC-type heme-binding CxxCH protein [Planctomycetota bacterium]|nr:PVC-type heme-binding CxxCH protein [Planctomycetota bacterium]